MRYFIYIFLLMFCCQQIVLAQDLNAFFEQADLFMSKYSQHNSVQYKVLDRQPKELKTLVGQIESIDLSTASTREQKAFFINAYNLLVIQNVVEHYPIASPNEIVEFWDEIIHVVAGEKYTLETFKTEILIKFPDPLLHFVLVDATVSAAPIASFAYMPSEIDQQLENRSVEALNNSRFVKYDKTIEVLELPVIFKNYANSFQPTTIAFVNKFRAQKISENATIKFSNYDWTLNAFFGDMDISLNKKKKEVAVNSLADVLTLPKNTVELMLFNSLFTATYGNKYDGLRSSYFNSFFSVSYGITGRLDVGFNFLLRSSRIGDHFTSSPFEVFEFERVSPNAYSKTNSTLYSDWGLSHIGAQVRFAPFKNINLSFEQGLMFPIKNLPADNTVDQNLYSISQIYFIHPFSSQWQLNMALSYWQPINPKGNFMFQPPMIRGILNYFATPRFSVFISTMYCIEWGAGFKLMLTPKLELQAMYSYFLPIPGLFDLFSPGATSVMTYNMGFRYRF